MRYILRSILGILVTILCWSVNVNAQGVIITGQVLDVKDDEMIPFASILFKNETLNTTTDEEGKFYLVLNDTLSKYIYFEASGYAKDSLLIDYNQPLQSISIRLKSKRIELEGTTVIAKKTKYSNKDNPAVMLIKQVIAHKDQNRYLYQKGSIQQTYDKIQLGLINPPKIATDNFISKRFSYVFNNQDTNKVKGASVLPVYLEEQLLKNYYRAASPSLKSNIMAHKKVSFSEKYISNDMINNYLTHIYRDIDLYDNQSLIMTNMFTSPIAATAPLYYKYYINDTTYIGNDTIISLAFEPRNKIDFLYNGFLKIKLNDFALVSANLGMSRHINLNFVKNYQIVINYAPFDGQYYKYSTHQMMEFGDRAVKNSIYAERLFTVNHIEKNTNLPDSIFNNAHLKDTADNYFESNALWAEARPVPLTLAEEQTYINMQRLNESKYFDNLLKFGRFLMGGYYRTKYFEIGPLSTFLAHNPVEGWKWRVSGRTPIDLTKNWHSEVYVAYGTKDERFKYFWSGAIALNKDKNKYLTHYPYNHIKFTIQNDTRLPGSTANFIQEGNIVESFKRGINDKYILNHYYKAEYIREFANHIRINPFITYNKEQPLGSWYYIKETNQQLDTLKEIVRSEIGVHLRWAPNEKIMQSRTSRTNLTNEYPIIDFHATYGLPNVLGSEHSYQIYKLATFKRFYMGQFGFLDSRLGGTYIIGEQLPFILLDIPRANQAITYSSGAYSLMNYMEFVSDQSAYVNLHWHPGGFFLKKIPLIKHLKFREVFGFKAIYGTLNDANNPLINSDVIKYPIDENGAYTTQSFNGKPYMEASIGLTNILKVGRVDAVWRLTHTDHPNISRFGLRFGVYIDF